MSNANTTQTSPKMDAAPVFPTFDPMAMWSTTQQAWQKLMGDAFSRTQVLAEQYVAIESQMMTRAHDAITTWAQLTHDALSYGVQLSAESRKIGLDAARKVTAQAPKA
jgi:hypothetical protein